MRGLEYYLHDMMHNSSAADGSGQLDMQHPARGDASSSFIDLLIKPLSGMAKNTKKKMTREKKKIPPSRATLRLREGNQYRAAL